jgi:hypothetical protein
MNHKRSGEADGEITIAEKLPSLLVVDDDSQSQVLTDSVTLTRQQICPRSIIIIRSCTTAAYCTISSHIYIDDGYSSAEDIIIYDY